MKSIVLGPQNLGTMLIVLVSWQIHFWTNKKSWDRAFVFRSAWKRHWGDVEMEMLREVVKRGSGQAWRPLRFSWSHVSPVKLHPGTGNLTCAMKGAMSKCCFSTNKTAHKIQTWTPQRLGMTWTNIIFLSSSKPTNQKTTSPKWQAYHVVRRWTNTN